MTNAMTAVIKDFPATPAGEQAEANITARFNKGNAFRASLTVGNDMTRKVSHSKGFGKGA